MPIKMSGLTLSSTLESLHCFILIDWKFTLRIHRGTLSFVCHGGFLLGVEVVSGFSRCLDGSGLSKEMSGMDPILLEQYVISLLNKSWTVVL